MEIGWKFKKKITPEIVVKDWIFCYFSCVGYGSGGGALAAGYDSCPHPNYLSARNQPPPLPPPEFNPKVKIIANLAPATALHVVKRRLST